MNIYGTIVIIQAFRKVTYYSVQIEEEDSLFLQFLNDHANEKYQDELDIIREWLQRIGDKIGAKEHYFRNEAFRGDARALPPPSKFLELDCNLRLYCMRINRYAVVLFNGAEKTAATAQACDNVRPHFLLANRLTKVIDSAIIDGEISIDDDTGELIFDESLLLEL
ncbi:MAG: hypothetical protein AAF847_00895 [Bacteroidota bacterium]